MRKKRNREKKRHDWGARTHHCDRDGLQHAVVWHLHNLLVLKIYVVPHGQVGQDGEAIEDVVRGCEAVAAHVGWVAAAHGALCALPH